MRRVTTIAALSLYRDMLVHERPLLVGVALVADRIAAGQRPRLADCSRTVSVVTVAALDQSFVDPMAIRFGEICFGLGVTAITELRLFADQKELGLGCMMRGMAIKAAYVVAGMGRCRVVPLLVLLTVATEASGAGLLPRQGLEADDLRDISAPFNVLRARPMARFAPVPILQGGLEMRSALEILLVEIFVAGFAGFGAQVVGRLILRRSTLILLSSNYHRAGHEQHHTSRPGKR